MFMRIVGNSVGAAVFGAILNFGINRRIPEAGDAVNRLLEPAARHGLGAAEIGRLSEAVASSLHIVYVVAGLVAVVGLFLALSCHCLGGSARRVRPRGVEGGSAHSDVPLPAASAVPWISRRAHRCRPVATTLRQRQSRAPRSLLPQIWLYAVNDHYFEPNLAHAVFEAYRASSRAPVSFVDLPTFGDDGHLTFSRGDPAIWAATVDRDLASLQGASPARKRSRPLR
jgi:hypothetical protein